MQRLRDRNGNPLPPNVAMGQHLPSPVPPAYSSAAAAAAADLANDVRNLAPAERYLSERGSRVRRQSVCLTLAPASRLVFEARTTPDAPLCVQDSVVPLLLSLAQCTTLHCIVVEADKDKQASEDSGHFGLCRARASRAAVEPRFLTLAGCCLCRRLRHPLIVTVLCNVCSN